MIDGDINTCSAVPIPKIKGAIPQYQIGINGTCTKNPNLIVTMGISATCSDLRSALFTEKPRSGCNGVRNNFDVCDVTAEFKFYNTRQCYMRCKCAESANQCVLHIVSGISRKSVSICEIVKY